jgi:hypothetical protein
MKNPFARKKNEEKLNDVEYIINQPEEIHIEATEPHVPADESPTIGIETIKDVKPEELYEDDLFYDLNVISIGDGKEEKKAVFNLAKDLKLRKLRTKFIRMISFPSAASIVLQLKYLNNNINEMILDENSIYKMSIKFNNKKVEIDCKAKKGKNCKENGEKNYLNHVEENEFKQELKQKNENYHEKMLFNDIENNKEMCGNKLLGQKSFLIK